MRSARRGKRTSAVEVTNVSTHGFWLLIEERELFVSFRMFPWFRDVPVGDLVDVRLAGPGHLYWEAIDVDLAVDSIEHPERFPLVSRRAIRSPSTGGALATGGASVVREHTGGPRRRPRKRSARG